MLRLHSQRVPNKQSISGKAVKEEGISLPATGISLRIIPQECLLHFFP